MLKKINFIFHYLDEIYRKYLFYINFDKKKYLTYKNIINDIQKNSYFIKKNYLSKKKCKILKNSLDKILHSNKKNKFKYWHDDKMSDQRIWRFHNVDTFAKQIMNDKFINTIASAITGRKKHAKIVMGNKVVFKKNNFGSGGGWHRDSPYRTQFKAFLYLNDVGIKQGPLELLPGSHTAKFIKKLSNFNLMPEQFRFSNKLVLGLLKKKTVKKISISEKAGTLIMANTKCIHRGSPIKSKNRYAITVYFGDPNLPKFI